MLIKFFGYIKREKKREGEEGKKHKMTYIEIIPIVIEIHLLYSHISLEIKFNPPAINIILE